MFVYAVFGITAAAHAVAGASQRAYRVQCGSLFLIKFMWHVASHTVRRKISPLKNIACWFTIELRRFCRATNKW